jgi:hypothetical protein
MDNLILTVAGILVGIGATVFVGRYFFNRTFERSLTPFIHLHSLVLADIDPEVRSELRILFQDQPVDDLTHLQLLIANTGSRAIRDCIKPLSITFPSGIVVLDHAIIHKNPKELDLRSSKVSADEHSQEKIEISFPLLNRGDFFLVKFLLKGTLKPFEADCRIAVDDLPPKLELTWLPSSATRNERKTVDWGAFGFGLLVLAITASISYVLFLLWKSQPTIFPFPWETYKFSLLTALILGFHATITLLLFIVGIIMTTGIAFDEVFSGSKHRYPLPESLQPSPRFRLKSQDIVMEFERGVPPEGQPLTRDKSKESREN